LIQVITDENGIHDIGVQGVDIQSIGDTDDEEKVPLTLNKTRPTADTEEFFTPVPFSAKVPGDKKKRVKCTSCAYALKFLFIIQIFS
jgi:hypothetical protein